MAASMCILCILFHVITSCNGKTGLRNVLVIGGTSFINYHISLNLVTSSGVIVLENFNNDDDIKKGRAGRLIARGVTVLDDSRNGCESYLLEDIFSHYSIDSVVYSSGVESPSLCNDGYNPLCISTEIKCLTRLLRILKKNKGVKFIYFSSLCVLDKSRENLSPFIAIKALAEDLVTSHFNEFNTKGVILRIDGSLYGPWSGPGSIVHELTTELYYNSDEIEHFDKYSSLKISPIHINSLVMLIYELLSIESPHREINLMSGHALQLNDIVKLLRTHLKTYKRFHKSTNKTVNVKFSEVCGQSSLSEYHFKDNFPLEEGLKGFLKWYDAYHRVGTKHSRLPIPDSVYVFKVKNKHLNVLGFQYRKRHKLIRKNYEFEAVKHNIKVAKMPPSKNFIFHKGVDSGTTNRIIPGLSIKEMKKLCRAVFECVAFTTEGHFKTIIQPKAQWRTLKPSSSSIFSSHHTIIAGLYVADIDVCAAGLHNCYGNATCKYLGPSQFKCGCESGWIMHNDSCVPIYCEGHLTPVEEYYKLIDIVEGRQDMQLNASFIEYKNMMSSVNSHHEIIVTDFNGDIGILKRACLATYHCIGFSSSGVLKMEIEPSDLWITVKNESLFVLDIDHCAVSDRCMRPQKCRISAPGQYKCYLW